MVGIQPSLGSMAYNKKAYDLARFANSKPVPALYGVFTNICLIFMVNVGKYTIHGWYGKCVLGPFSTDPRLLEETMFIPSLLRHSCLNKATSKS